jgi:hypothetical protein
VALAGVSTETGVAFRHVLQLQSLVRYEYNNNQACADETMALCYY